MTRLEYHCDIHTKSHQDAHVRLLLVNVKLQEIRPDRSLSAKEPLIIGLFYGKRPIQIQCGETHRMPYLDRSFSAKEPLIIGLFYGKRPIQI